MTVDRCLNSFTNLYIQITINYHKLEPTQVIDHNASTWLRINLFF